VRPRGLVAFGRPLEFTVRPQRMRITPQSRAHLILRGLSSFHSDTRVPEAVQLSSNEQLLGILRAGNTPEVVLTDLGSHIRSSAGWSFVSYGDIEVEFPPKEWPGAPLTLVTPRGRFTILAGTRDIWEVGRYFRRCSGDARAA
jgi:hypothetical protein